MYLKAIEILGFKSFAEKTRFDFKQGITSVIGPNGCGKSNVVDAIRWCIGEMSWKSLRSGSMADIIFNGSSKRPQMGMAEVTLVFDNESRRLPIDFLEVTVTRKIFRSGESEYFLNKIQCRLRDIRDLFLDTGIGGEGYAIIDQGGVEFVLSANPEARRELFEEAAGVSKYKAKRDEAQKKLEKVDQDLARLMDSVVLIEEQIKKLDSEARKARLYQKYREELKEAEISQILSEISACESEMNKDGETLKPVSEKIADAGAALSALEGEAAALALNLSHKQNELNQAAQDISGAKYQIGLIEGNLRNFDATTELLLKQISGFDHDDELAKTRRAELEPALEAMRSQAAELDEKIAPVQAEHEQKVSALNAAEAEISAAQHSLDKANSDLMAASQAEMDCAGKLALEQSSITHDNEDLINSEKERLKTSGQIESLSAELEKLRAAAEEARAAVSGAEAEISELETQKSALSSSSLELSEKLSAARSRKAALTATTEFLQNQGGKDPYWLGTQAVSQMPGMRGTLRQSLKFSAEDRVLVEDSLGKFLDSVICDSFEAALSASDSLKTGNARCRFIVPSAVPPSEPAEGGLKSRLGYPPELENLLNHLLAGASAGAGTARGPFWLSCGAENVSSPEPYWGQAEEARLSLEAAQSDENSLAVEAADSAQKAAALDERLAYKREALSGLAAKKTAAEVALASNEQTLRLLNETLSLVSKEQSAIASRLAARNSALSALKEEIAGLKDSSFTARTRIEELKALRSAGQEKLSRLKAERETCALKLSELRTRRNSLEADLKSAHFAYNELAQTASRRAEQREEAKARIERFAADKLSAQAGLSGLRDSLAALETGEAEARRQLEALRSECDAKTSAAGGRKDELSKLQMAAQELEIRLESLRARREALASRLQDDWQTGVEEARMKYGGAEVDHERVKMMRRRLENMGPVNMTAPEEYDALTARDQFLKTQIADLDQAKNDLKAAISKINATTRENFRHTFDTVRGHFRRIYQTLFAGGEADIVLTQPENLLETGVEIMAQPPGKRLQSISALSGGEKALTALALLFSFFCVNPSPFCVMDEADAPLDEANVERFMALLKEFAATTQFITITHNKRTMEAADILYGVTMEESGVSKIMSVSLKKDEAPLRAAAPAAA